MAERERDAPLFIFCVELKAIRFVFVSTIRAVIFRPITVSLPKIFEAFANNIITKWKSIQILAS
jgi:hypothetical protein